MADSPSIPDEVWLEIVSIVRLLASGHFDSLGARAGRCQPDDLARVIREYGRSLVELPEAAFKLANAYAVVDGSLTIDVPLWTAEEGRSDLELRVEATNVDGRWAVIVSDLLVP